MGVMSCSKRDCENIMCDTYVDGVGYVCWECKDMFKQWMSTSETHPGRIKQEFEAFMNEHKSDFSLAGRVALVIKPYPQNLLFKMSFSPWFSFFNQKLQGYFFNLTQLLMKIE